MHYGILLLTFLSVNLDFFFMLIFLLRRYPVIKVVWGYLLGNWVLLILSYLLGKALLLVLPEWLLGILGFLPIYMAFHDEDDADGHKTSRSPVWSVLVTYLSVCSGCNLAIFLPVLVGETLPHFILALGFISLLTVGAVLLVKGVAQVPAVETLMAQRGEQLMKLCYVLIGLYVFWDSGLISHLFGYLP
ncbi:cadmium resistance transporter [Levilactobacillus brevis]|uniref:cadmium resistance transporter n=1 Tax=Levilactobacillus brevis TaxID=1580 RepID=UPI0035103422